MYKDIINLVVGRYSYIIELRFAMHSSIDPVNRVAKGVSQKTQHLFASLRIRPDKCRIQIGA